ncbi:MAG TPA: hypothetical protein VLA95_01640 [Gemmatimonadales bacterium]|nr:hypothetical protein [Gemmatimonadales bacterium]
MTEQPRNWDKELADIDKLIEAGPPALPAPPQTGGRKDGASAPPLPTSRPPVVPTRGGAWRSWAKAGLGALLAVAMTQWPYAHRCGLGAVLYLGAAGVVVLAGLWSAVSSWRRHAAGAHVLSLGVILAGLVLTALEVAPRVGYAKVDLPWMCG